MKIALPLTETGEFSPHFGAAARAGIFEIDLARRAIVRSTVAAPDAAEPCAWPDWLHEQGVQLFFACGMGEGARARMARCGIEVVVGVTPAEPSRLVQRYLDGGLVLGPNGCEGHGHGHGSDAAHPHDHDGCGCAH